MPGGSPMLVCPRLPEAIRVPSPVGNGTHLGGSGPRSGRQQAGPGWAGGGRLAWGPSWRAWPGRALSQRMCADAPGWLAPGPPPGLEAPGSRPPQLPGDLCFCPGRWRPCKCAGVVRRQQWQLHEVTPSPCPGCPGRSWPGLPQPSSCPRHWVISLARYSQKN